MNIILINIINEVQFVHLIFYIVMIYTYYIFGEKFKNFNHDIILYTPNN